jgi:hypothetical protein
MNNRKTLEVLITPQKNIPVLCFNFAFKIYIYSDTESKPIILTDRSIDPILITNNLNLEFYFKW